jgi:hypothetical protein
MILYVFTEISWCLRKTSAISIISVTARTRRHSEGVVDCCIPKILN